MPNESPGENTAKEAGPIWASPPDRSVLAGAFGWLAGGGSKLSNVARFLVPRPPGSDPPGHPTYQ